MSSSKKRKQSHHQQQHPKQPPKSGLGGLRKVHKGEIIEEIGRLSIEDLRKTLLASELSRRDGWKMFYESEKKVKKLEAQLEIEQKRAKNICPICNEMMTNSTPTSTEFCGHTFHKDCINAFRQGVFGDAEEHCPLNCE